MIVYQEIEEIEDTDPKIIYTITAKTDDFTEFVNSLGATNPVGQYEVVFENEAYETEPGEWNNDWSYSSISKDGVKLPYLKAPWVFEGSNYSGNLTIPVTIEVIPVYEQ